MTIDPKSFNGNPTYIHPYYHINLEWELNDNGNDVMLVSGVTIDSFDPDSGAIPSIGTLYNVGDTITGDTGDSRVLYTGNTLTYLTETLLPATVYNYKLYSFTNPSNPYLYSDYSTGLELTLSTVLPPLSINGGATSSSEIDLSWELDGTTPVHSLLVSGVTIGHPEDEIVYQVGDTIPGGGEVLYYGTNETHTVENIQPYTNQIFKVFSYLQTSAPFYATDGQQITLSTFPDTVDDTTGFSAIPISHSRIDISWDSVGSPLGINGIGVLLVVSGGTFGGTFGGTIGGPPVEYHEYKLYESLDQAAIVPDPSGGTVTYIGTSLGYSNIELDTFTPYNYKLYKYVSIYTNTLLDGPLDLYFYSTGVELTSKTYVVNGSGFYDGKFLGGYFNGDWYGGKWVAGFFLSGATWHPDSRRPGDNTQNGNSPSVQ